MPDTTYTRRSRLLIYTPPPAARRLRTRLHTRTPSDTAKRVILARGARRFDAHHDPSSKTGSHRAAHHPHTGTRLPHASVAHFDTLYFNLSVAGVPLFKADRGAPPVMGVLPIYRSTDLPRMVFVRGKL